MSAPNESNNPWVTLAELLKSGVSEAVLATAIEKGGVYVYDRFGRRVVAKDDGPEPNISKQRALDLLADHYEYLTNTQIPDELASDNLFYDEPDFYKFGWPRDETPDLTNIEIEPVPTLVKKGKINLDAPPCLKKHRTYLVIIGALCNLAKVKYSERGQSKALLGAIHDLNVGMDDQTLRTVLKDIDNAIEERS